MPQPPYETTAVDDPLAGLDDVPWARLSHAYGSASDVPETLRSLRSARPAQARSAIARLEGTIWHQGTVYDATAPAVPFLRALAAVPGGAGRDRMLILLRWIAAGTGYRTQHARLAWAPPEDPDELAEALSQEQRWVVAARRAVVDGVEEYLAALEDGDAKVRAAAGYLLAACVPHAETVLPALLDRLAAEPVPAAKVCAILAMGELAGATCAAGHAAAVRAGLSALLDDPDRAVRTAAAIALRWQEPTGAAPRPVQRALADALGRRLPALARAPWAEGDTYELIAAALGSDLSENVALIREALSARTPGRRDGGVSRGSELMYRWRDAPPLVVPVIAAALGDPAPAVRAHAAKVLLDNAGPALCLAADHLAAALAGLEQRMDLDRPGQLDPDFGGLREPDEELAIATLTALGRLGDARCLPAIGRVLVSGAIHPDWKRALGGLAGHAPALAPLIGRYIRRAEPPSDVGYRPRWGQTIAAITAWGTAAEPLAADLLVHARATHRADLCEALAAITPPEHALAAQVAAVIRDAFAVHGDRWWAGSLALWYWRVTGDHDTALTWLSTVFDRKPGEALTFDALAELGPRGAPLLDRVRDAITDDSALLEHRRVAAAHAHWRITGDPGPALPVLLAALSIKPLGVAVAGYLGEIGPPATAAVPVLRDIRDRRRRVLLGGFLTPVDQDEEFRAIADQALNRIEPSQPAA